MPSTEEPTITVDAPAWEAVVFDCDGTLLDSEPLAGYCEALLLAEHGYEMTDDDHVACTGYGQTATYEYFAARVSLPPERVFWDAFDTLFSTHSGERLHAFPDALKAVALLAGQGTPVAVASSTPRKRLDKQLAHGGLIDCFDAVVAGDEVAVPKPAPDPYLTAARLLGVEPDRCLAVEDSRPGIESARAAGMRVVMIDRKAGAGSCPADVRVTDLMSAEALSLWERAGR